jgi:hypothetical protein
MIWETVYRSLIANDGHKIFLRPADGAISLCDWSGATPGTTDDGPLIVAPNAECTGDWLGTGGGFFFHVPVKMERPTDVGGAYVAINPKTMRELRKVLPKLRINHTPSYREMIDALVEVSEITPTIVAEQAQFKNVEALRFSVGEELHVHWTKRAQGGVVVNYTARMNDTVVSRVAFVEDDAPRYKWSMICGG